MSEQQLTSQNENSASVTVTVSSDQPDTHTQFKGSVFNYMVAGGGKHNPFDKLKCHLSTNQRSGPLSDVRVLDLTRIVAGPYCSMILGDLGADIIKIERPGSGDEARKWGPPFINNTDESCYFMCLNRNKRSVCVDMKAAEGKDIILELSKKCDVLIENYVPGTLTKLGLGYESIKEIAPQLIYCSITGYGSRGPYCNRPGYDVIAASYGGLMSITGPKDGPPCKVGVAATDMATGLYAHGAILAALLERAKSGKGQKIDCNLLSTQVACLINIGANFLNAGEVGERWGSSHVSIVPYRTFETSDGKFITVGSGSDLQFQNLCEKLELEDLSQSKLFKTNKDRVANRDSLDSVLEKRFKSKTLNEWLHILEGATFPYGPVNDMSQVFDDEHIKDIGLVKEIKHPKAGTVKVVGPPVEFSYSNNSVYSPPPMLGQHTEEVLYEVLGYSNEKIQELKMKKIDLTTFRLKLRKPKSTKKVNWTEGTVDNENMDKKKSKCCCIYQKPRAQDESSSEDESDGDECEHCFGHVEKKKSVLKKHSNTPSPDPGVQSMITA